MTTNTYILEQIGSVKNKGYREYLLKCLLEEGKSMEVRCKNVLSPIWGSFISNHTSYHSLNPKESSTILSALLYMHTSELAETLCFIGAFLDNLEWPKDDRLSNSNKDEQAKVVCVFIHSIISGLVEAMHQYTKDLTKETSLVLEKRVAIFIVELLYRQSSLKLDLTPIYRGQNETKPSPNVHDFGDRVKQYLLPDSKFVEKNLRPKLFAKEMQKRKFENVTCKPAKQVLDQILQTSFSTIEDYNLRTALVCRGVK